MMDSADAVSLCELCPVASRRAAETGDLVECDCGRPWKALQRPASPQSTGHPVGRFRGASGGRPGPRLVYVAPDGEPDDGLSPLARAGAAARARCADDPELVRVRRLLADLRPDCADPLCPPVVEEQPAQTVRVRDPLAGWGDIPRGIGGGLGAQLDAAALFDRAGAVAEILAAIDALPAPAPRVLRWLRDHAMLSSGLRGLYVDAGLWSGAGMPQDLGSRREAAYLVGRRLVLGAAGAWGR